MHCQASSEQTKIYPKSTNIETTVKFVLNVETPYIPTAELKPVQAKLLIEREKDIPGALLPLYSVHS